MFGMLSWNQKPLWADSCHICLFGQMRERSSAAFCRGAGGRLWGCARLRGDLPGAAPPAHAALPSAGGSADLELGQVPEDLCSLAVPCPGLISPAGSSALLPRSACVPSPEGSGHAGFGLRGSLAERGRGGCRVLLLAGF